MHQIAIFDAVTHAIPMAFLALSIGDLQEEKRGIRPVFPALAAWDVTSGDPSPVIGYFQTGRGAECPWIQRDPMET